MNKRNIFVVLIACALITLFLLYPNKNKSTFSFYDYHGTYNEEAFNHNSLVIDVDNKTYTYYCFENEPESGQLKYQGEILQDDQSIKFTTGYLENYIGQIKKQTLILQK